MLLGDPAAAPPEEPLEAEAPRGVRVLARVGEDGDVSMERVIGGPHSLAARPRLPPPLLDLQLHKVLGLAARDCDTWLARAVAADASAM